MMEARDVINIYNNLEKNGIGIWIDGGWGVDALLEKQTRPHKDLDIAIEKKNLEKFLKLLENFSKVPKPDSKPHNFVISDKKGNEIDIHVIVINEKGDGIYGPPEKNQIYPAGALTGLGKIDGVRVRCISAEWMVKFHSGYELKEKDYEDIKALCDKFSIVLPDEYNKFEEN